MDNCVMCLKKKWFGKFENGICPKCILLESLRKQADRMVEKYKDVIDNKNVEYPVNEYYTSNTSSITNYSTITNTPEMAIFKVDSGDSSNHCESDHRHSSSSDDSYSGHDSSNDSLSDCSCDCGGCD